MVTSVSAAQTVATQAGTTSTPAALTSDFETFLKMLTAQARFQDPLKPIDSTEYAAQLAQFSMVEQQVLTNDTLKALAAQFGAQSPTSLAAWVGMEARAVTPLAFDGQPITIAPEVPVGASGARLVVRNASGAEVQRLTIPLLADTVQWTGQKEGGGTFPAGTYSFEVEALTNGEVTATTQAAVYARVTEAQLNGGAVVLIFEGGTAVPASAVTALREAA
ncbi:MAG: hypothetical protein KDK24_05500 [Pseudooceanicola sp.]|nr:hypothetical protein [Pseudooceanicola sp.]